MSTKPGEGGGDGRNRFSRQIDEAFDEVSKLAGSNLPPADFYAKFLDKALAAIDAPAGAIWMRTPQGFLQMACQHQLDKVGLESKRGGRQCHNEVLRQVFQAQPPRPVMVEPNGKLGTMTEPGALPAANLTDYFALFAPIVSPDKQSLGLFEVFQDSSHDPRLYPTFLNYAVQMAGYASQYHQYTNARQASGMERVFARLIHGSLNPTECAYHVANEGRKLAESDRLSVGVRHARRKVTVEAVSGADVVEKASTHIRYMRRLMEAVLVWGEKLVFKGTKDEGLPPDVSHALDDYLAESQPKFLVVMPIRDEREKDESKPARSVLILESFNPPEQVEPIIQRLEVVGKHAAPALYNAAEMKRVPLKPLWWPIAKVQEGLGGKARAIAALVAVAVVALTLAMIFVPYPLRMDAKGQMLPVEIGQVFAPREGIVREIRTRPGDRIDPGFPAVYLFSAELEKEATDVRSKLNEAIAQRDGAARALAVYTDVAVGGGHERRELETKLRLAELTISQQQDLLRDLEGRNQMVAGSAGTFRAIAPPFDQNLKRPVGASRWTTLNDENRERLLGRTVRPNEPLLRVGNLAGTWQVELKIPQRNVGQVLKAFATPGMFKQDNDGKPYLDVDVLLSSQPDRKYLGRLYRDGIAGEAVPNQNDHDENEPIVTAYVKLNLDDFPAALKVPEDQFVTGLEVRTRVRCGDHALGYSMFHGVWEWFYEKVIFSF